MIDLNRMKMENGYCTYNGRTYILTRPAYIVNYMDTARYEAPAIIGGAEPDEDGFVDVWAVSWSVLNNYLAATADMADCNPGDESDACNWDNPDDVSGPVGGYDLATGIYRG